MNTIFSPESVRLFQSSQCKLSVHENGFSIHSDVESAKNQTALVFIAGMAIIAIAIYQSEWYWTLPGIVLMIYPFISSGWKSPESVFFNTIDPVIQLHFPYHSDTIGIKQKPELIVEYYTRTTGVSPFEEGYQIHTYKFLLKTRESTIKELFRLYQRSHNPEALIADIVDDLKTLPIWRD